MPEEYQEGVISKTISQFKKELEVADKEYLWDNFIVSTYLNVVEETLLDNILETLKYVELVPREAIVKALVGSKRSAH